MRSRALQLALWNVGCGTLLAPGTSPPVSVTVVADVERNEACEIRAIAREVIDACEPALLGELRDIGVVDVPIGEVECVFEAWRRYDNALETLRWHASRTLRDRTAATVACIEATVRDEMDRRRGRWVSFFRRSAQ